MGSWLPVPAQHPASARAKVRVSSCFHLAVPALQPGPWQTGPPPSHTHGPQDVWDKPPWEHQHRRGRGRWCPVRGQGPGRAARGDGAVGFYLHVWGGQSWGFPREQERQKEPRAVAGRGNSSKSKTPQRAAVLTSNRLPLQRHPWDPRPFPGPADFHGNEEGRWAPHDCPPSPSWDDREDRGGPEDFFREGWHRVRGEMGGGGWGWQLCGYPQRATILTGGDLLLQPGPWDPRPLPGPADFHGNEEDRRWATHNHAPPPPWDDREDNQGPEEYFGEVWDQVREGDGLRGWQLYGYAQCATILAGNDLPL